MLVTTSCTLCFCIQALCFMRNITWDNHIDQLISRFNSASNAITAVKAVLSRKALIMLYFSYVYSIISYATILGGNTHNSIKIIRMQEKILRIITNLKKMD